MSSGDAGEFLVQASLGALKEHHAQKLIALGLLNITVQGPTCHLAQCDVEKAIQEATRAFGGPDEQFEVRVQQALEIEERIQKALQRLNELEQAQTADEGGDFDKYAMISDRVWRSANPTTWYHVMRLYILFLEGVIPASPTHLAPITLDVQQTSVKTLLDINRLGFVTMDSQPGVCESFENPHARGVEVQREYIRGSFPSAYATLLFDKLVQVAGDYIDITVNRATEPLPTTMGKIVHANHLPTIGRRPFENASTIIKRPVDVVLTAATTDADDEWFIDTASNRRHFETFYDHPEQEHFNKRHGVESDIFELIARDYCRPGLVAECLRYALCSIQPLPTL